MPYTLCTKPQAVNTATQELKPNSFQSLEASVTLLYIYRSFMKSQFVEPKSHIVLGAVLRSRAGDSKIIKPTGKVPSNILLAQAQPCKSKTELKSKTLVSKP